MTEQTQAKFDGWAIVDVLGHQRYVGYVTTEAYGQAVLFRVDVPALDERERVTKQPGYGPDGRYLPAGTTVKEGAVDGYSKLIGAGSIYAISPCTKDAALKAIEEGHRRPLMQITLPEGRALSPGRTDADYPDDIDDEDEDDACESCGQPFTSAVETYVTNDDVRLCRRCYEAVPIAPSTPAPTG